MCVVLPACVCVFYTHTLFKRSGKVHRKMLQWLHALRFTDLRAETKPPFYSSSFQSSLQCLHSSASATADSFPIIDAISSKEPVWIIHPQLVCYLAKNLLPNKLARQLFQPKVTWCSMHPDKILWSVAAKRWC